MKLFKGFMLSLMLMIATISFSQNYSVNTYYAQKGHYRNVYIGKVQQWVCCDNWGNGYYVWCNQYKETLWVEKYGYRKVRIWGTNGWYWTYQEGYYWYYSWNFYNKC